MRSVTAAQCVRWYSSRPAPVVWCGDAHTTGTNICTRHRVQIPFFSSIDQHNEKLYRWCRSVKRICCDLYIQWSGLIWSGVIWSDLCDLWKHFVVAYVHTRCLALLTGTPTGRAQRLTLSALKNLEHGVGIGELPKLWHYSCPPFLLSSKCQT